MESIPSSPGDPDFEDLDESYAKNDYFEQDIYLKSEINLNSLSQFSSSFSVICKYRIQVLINCLNLLGLLCLKNSLIFRKRISYEVTDIWNSNLYKSSDIVLNSISLILFIDGAQFNKSENGSLWAILGIISNLAPTTFK